MATKQTDAAQNPALEEENKQLREENKRLKQQLRFGQEVPEELEELIQAKITAGVPRDMAIQVVKDQLAHDAQLLKAGRK